MLRRYAWSGLHLVVARGAAFAAPMLVASQMAPDRFGVFVTLSTIAILGTTIADFGLTASVSRAVAGASGGDSAAADTAQVISSALAAVLGTSLAVSLATVVGVWAWDPTIGFRVPLILGAWVALASVNTVLEAVSQGRDRFGLMFSGAALGAIAAAVAWFALPRPFTLETGLVFSSVLPGGSLAVHLWAHRRSISLRAASLRTARELYGYAVWVAAATFAYFLYTRADILILAQAQLQSEIGVYELATRVVTLSTLPAFVVARVIGVRVARSFGAGERPTWLRLWRFRWPVCGLGVVGGLGSYFLLRWGVARWLPAYDTASFATAATTLLPLIPLKVWGTVLTHGFAVPSGHVAVVARWTVVGGVANVLLSLAAVRLFGFEGVIWTTVIVHSLAIVAVDAGLSRALRVPASPVEPT